MTLLVLVCSAGFTSASPQPPPPPSVPPEFQQHPYGGRKPVEVSVGLFITNLAIVEEAREQFEAEGYFTLRWRDPRLALPADSPTPGHLREFSIGDIWAPGIETANLVSHSKGNSLLEVDDDGNVRYTERFDTTISSSYALRGFPFDRQLLRFNIEPFLPKVSEISFADTPADWTGIDLDLKATSGLAAWKILDLNYHASEVAASGPLPARPRAAFELRVARRSGFYLWKILLPMILLAVIPWSVFWYKVQDFSGQMSIPLGIMLSLVAFQFAIARDLPRVGYLTFLDALLLNSFFFVFLCLLEITLAYIIQAEGRRPLAERIRCNARWIFPVAYFSTLLFLTVIF